MSHALRRIIINAEGLSAPYEYSGKGAKTKATSKFDELRRGGKNPIMRTEVFKRGAWREEMPSYTRQAERRAGDR